MKAQPMQNLAGQLRVIALDIASGSSRDTDAETVALAALVLDEHARIALAGELSNAPSHAPAVKPEPKKAAAKSRAPKGQGAHRHNFDSLGKCTGCPASRKRAPNGSSKAAAAAPGGVVSLPLPVVNSRPLLGDHAPDEFDGGTFGSSGTGDGRR